MGIFKHEGRGFYIGSTIIVKADNINEAILIIRKILDSEGLTKEEVDVVDISNENILHVDNGDY